MDMIEHIELPRESAVLLFDAYISWFEDFDSGFEEGIYDSQPDEDDRIAYEFATGSRADPDAAIVRLPWHAVVAIEAGVSSYLEDLASGLTDGTYEDEAPEGIIQAVEFLTAWLQQVDRYAAIALEAGSKSYLDDPGAGPADGSYDQAATDGPSEDRADLHTRAQASAHSIQP